MIFKQWTHGALSSSQLFFRTAISFPVPRPHNSEREPVFGEIWMSCSKKCLHGFHFITLRLLVQYNTGAIRAMISL